MINKATVICFTLLILLPWRSVYSETIISSEYLPLNDGNTWVYDVTGTYGSYTETISVLPGTTVINGVPTKAVKLSSGFIDYYTSDAGGIKQYREFDTTDSSSFTFIPPIRSMNGIANIPETINSSGTVLVDIPGVWSGSLSYIYSSTLEAIDTIHVPAGVYDTIRIKDTLDIFGDISGEPFDYKASSTFWLARYIGEIKEITTDDEGTEVFVLTDTNVKPPPDPSNPFLSILPILPLILE